MIDLLLCKTNRKRYCVCAKTQDDLLSRQCARIGSNCVTLFGQYVHVTVSATQAVFKTAF